MVKLLDEGLVEWEELPQRYREHPYFNLDRAEEIVTGPPYPLYQTLQTALQGIFIILKYYLKTGGGGAIIMGATYCFKCVSIFRFYSDNTPKTFS